jgi:outer membrane protein
VGASTSLDLGYSSQKYSGSPDATKYTNINLNPRAGYFIMNGVAVGIDLNYLLSRSKYDDNDPNTTTEFRIGPFGRYYYKSVGPVRPFGEVKGGGGTSASRYFITV